MYQYTTTTVLNSLTDSSGYDKVSATATELNVKRVNRFVTANVNAVYKKAYAVGVKEVATVVMPSITAGKVARLNIEIGLAQSANHEYASTYLDFKKPVVVEVIATGVVDTDGAALVAELNSLTNRFGYSYITATYTTGTDTITLTAKDDNQRFNSITVEEETPNTSSITLIDFEVKATGAVTVTGTLGFGDDAWMIKSVQVPTIENQRYHGLNTEERPILGGNYTQYTIKYTVAKDHNDGVWAGATSVTNHVFWVKSDLVSAFEAFLVTAGLSVGSVGVTVTDVTIGGNTYDLSDATAIQLTATTTPAGVTGGLWSLTGTNTVAGTLDATKISLTSGGLFDITTGHGLANGDTIGVQIVISGFTKTGDITIQT